MTKRVAIMIKFSYPYGIMNTEKDKVQVIMPTPAVHWWQQTGVSTCTAPQPRPGDKCPACENGILAYDGLFVLTCSNCGKAAEAGAFT
ncbi:MAG: hypothetical protein KC419_19700 [Anaerolineales bacterium]|nr:hypothetical protein [Anaerolineales bacterium]MCA9930724.1 hypothetical protein [Anaerolineales bacterium]